MKMKLAAYAAKLLVENGISKCFSVTGGGAMHLNDGFGHEPGLSTLYMHHEQACSMAAESYARIYNKPALLCVTTGPGGTNALTGVLGAYLDSIPMLVISGQVRYDNTARWSGTGIRAMGDQEWDILRSADCMTKYSKMLLDPLSIRYELEKCLWLCQTGRPGPCWLDIPVDVQGTFIETEGLRGFDVREYEEERERELEAIDEAEEDAHQLTPGRYDNERMENPLLQIAYRKQHWQTPYDDTINKDSPVVDEILGHIARARRPVFYTGNGIRIAGAEDLFLKVADRLGIPVVVGWNGQDVIPSEHPLKAGQPGGRGDRPGNFAVQNADLILSVGSRLNIRQVGYNFTTWAREAYTIVCDIDEEELKKPSVHIDLPVHTDALLLLKALAERLEEMGISGHGDDYRNTGKIRESGYEEGGKFLFDGGEGKHGRNWRQQCSYWMEKYSVYQDAFAAHGDDEAANVYEFIDELSRALSEEQISVMGNGSACVAGGQGYVIKDGTRFISQDAVASMGYGLPAAIGACCGSHDVETMVKDVDFSFSEVAENRLERDRAFAEHELETAARSPWWKGRDEVYPPYYEHDVICVTGDGSIMMNLQELQTLISHRMPIKLFLINNGGYHSIRQTQHNLFEGRPLTGIGVDSFDLSFPDFERLALAFGIPYVCAEHNSQLPFAIKKTLAMKGPVLCEIFVSLDQPFEPRSAVRRHPDGSLSSPPLEDLAPFLSEEEMKDNMIIPMVEG